MYAQYTHCDEPLITYSFEEMQAHKAQFMHKMKNNSANIKDPTYQMKRALLTVSGDDADYIPKVVGAGEIFFDGSQRYQLMHNGVKVILNSYYDVQWLTDVICGLKGHHEPQEEKCFHEILKYMPEGASMLELVAYWAYYSLWFSSTVKNAKNFLVEPDPKRLEIGMRNFALNGKEGVFKRGFVGVMRDADPNIDGIEWISVDDFMDTHTIEHLNIVHADIQGAESDMLKTTIKHLEKIDYFVISTHDPERDHYPCLKFFRDHGLVILAEHTAYESCSGDGLIVARRKDAAGPDHISIKKYIQ